MNTTEISMKEKKTLIINAIRALGVNAKSLQITNDNDTVGNVYVNGEYFGVFDFVRRTFMD